MSHFPKMSSLLWSPLCSNDRLRAVPPPFGSQSVWKWAVIPTHPTTTATSTPSVCPTSRGGHDAMRVQPAHNMTFHPERRDDGGGCQRGSGVPAPHRGPVWPENSWRLSHMGGRQSVSQGWRPWREVNKLDLHPPALMSARATGSRIYPARAGNQVLTGISYWERWEGVTPSQKQSKKVQRGFKWSRLENVSLQQNKVGKMDEKERCRRSYHNIDRQIDR